MPMPTPDTSMDFTHLADDIKKWAAELGFQQVGITDADINTYETRLFDWLGENYHGEMSYMEKHGTKRTRPAELIEGTINIISVRMDYFPPDCELADNVLENKTLGYISRYALGRDYHKTMRKRLQALVNRIKQETGDFGHRVFVDSAPVMEKAFAEKSGLGWIGKHTNIINKQAGSWFFLGEIYTDLPLPTSDATENHCGTCQACIDICPTQAIISPYKLDARRCISYLTIELRDVIPEEFRSAIGNRIYGCDDCQLVCPWNRFSINTDEQDFFARHPLDAPDLLELINWDEKTFLKNTEGSAIRRIGYGCWVRNISIALGNSEPSDKTVAVLKDKRSLVDEMVVEHIDWAIEKLTNQEL